jgi:tetratricopeptide (TPR) repeat protein
MKTLFTSLLYPALAMGALSHLQLVSESYSRPTTELWPRWLKWNRIKFRGNRKNPEETELLNYHSLMVNAARYYTAKNYAAALKNYRRVLASEPQDTIALSGEAWSLYYLGEQAQAARDFQTLLSIDANDSWAREGITLCMTGRKEMAMSSTSPMHAA